MRYAVSDAKEYLASSRAEETFFIYKKFYKVKFFVNKDKKYHAAAGEFGIHRDRHPV